MATIYKRLGATAVTADTDTLAYTVPALTSAVVSSICVCNTGTTAETFRIALCPGAIGAVTLADYVYYDIPIGPKDTFVATCGFTIAAASQVLVRSSSANVVFSFYGSEVS